MGNRNEDLLSGLFSMLTIWRYIIAVQSEGKQRRKNYWLASFLYLCALLSKPSTVVLPLIVAAFDMVLYRRNWKVVLKWISPWLALSALTTLLAMQIQTMPAVFATPKWTRPLVGLDTLAFYIYKLVFPLYLSFDYGRTPAALMGEPGLHHPLYWSWIVPVVAALFIWKINRREITLGALIFLISIALSWALPRLHSKLLFHRCRPIRLRRNVGRRHRVRISPAAHSKKTAKITVAIVLPILSCLSFRRPAFGTTAAASTSTAPPASPVVAPFTLKSWANTKTWPPTLPGWQRPAAQRLNPTIPNIKNKWISARDLYTRPSTTTKTRCNSSPRMA